MKRRAPTIIDVAKAAGVSIATVSRTLNDGLVSARTRDRVMDAVQRLGYRQNSLARGLVTGRSGVIGVLIPDVVGPLYAHMARGIEETLAPLGMHYMMVTDNRDIDQERAAIELLLGRRVDALVIIGSRLPPDALMSLVPQAVPYVLVQRESGGEPGRPTIALDNDHAVRRVMDHLFRHGHRRIAHLSGTRRDGAERLASYQRVMAAQGLEPRVLDARATEEGGVEAGAKVAADDAISAVFCSNDRVAIGLYHALKTRGRRVPNDVSVVGFDDLPWSRYLDPPLTTIHQPGHEMGRRAAEIVVAQLHDADVHHDDVLIAPTLIERSSVAHVLEGGDAIR